MGFGLHVSRAQVEEAVMPLRLVISAVYAVRRGSEAMCLPEESEDPGTETESSENQRPADGGTRVSIIGSCQSTLFLVGGS